MVTRLVIRIHAIMLLTTAVVIASTPKILFAIDSDFVLLFDQTPRCNCVWLFLRAARSTIRFGGRALIIRIIASPLLCSKGCDLLIKFGLHLSQFCSECNDLILLANLTFPSAIFKYVVVGLDNFASMYDDVQ